MISNKSAQYYRLANRVKCSAVDKSHNEFTKNIHEVTTRFTLCKCDPQAISSTSYQKTSFVWVKFFSHNII